MARAVARGSANVHFSFKFKNGDILAILAFLLEFNIKFLRMVEVKRG